MDNIDYLFLEITSFCNMHCSFCPSDVLKRKKCKIKTENAIKFITEIHDMGIKKPIHLNVLGEPFLNNDIFIILDLLNKLEFTVILITNFVLLENKNLEKLMNYNNIVLVLSLQTLTVNSYKMRNYNNLTFNDYIDKIFNIIEYKFRSRNNIRIEIHIASTHTLLYHDSTYIADSPLYKINKIFNNDKELKKRLDWFIIKIVVF